MGFSIDIKTGNLYYFDKLISFTVPMEEQIIKLNRKKET
jgi:hypothetical protein